MSKTSPFASLATMPARANRPEPETEHEYAPKLAPAAAVDPTLSAPREIASEPRQEAPKPRPVTPPLLKTPTDKSIREKRTTRIDPGVYDAVERELSRQKRSGKRASSTLSDLLDELLRDWLRTHKVQIE